MVRLQMPVQWRGALRISRAHAHEYFPERDDVQWMRHSFSQLDAKHVEDAKVVLEYREVIDQPLDDQMHHVPSAKGAY